MPKRKYEEPQAWLPSPLHSNLTVARKNNTPPSSTSTSTSTHSRNNAIPDLQLRQARHKPTNSILVELGDDEHTIDMSNSEAQTSQTLKKSKIAERSQWKKFPNFKDIERNVCFNLTADRNINNKRKKLLRKKTLTVNVPDEDNPLISTISNRSAREHTTNTEYMSVSEIDMNEGQHGSLVSKKVRKKKKFHIKKYSPAKIDISGEREQIIINDKHCVFKIRKKQKRKLNSLMETEYLETINNTSMAADVSDENRCSLPKQKKRKSTTQLTEEPVEILDDTPKKKNVKKHKNKCFKTDSPKKKSKEQLFVQIKQPERISDDKLDENVTIIDDEECNLSTSKTKEQYLGNDINEQSRKIINQMSKRRFVVINDDPVCNPKSENQRPINQNEPKKSEPSPTVISSIVTITDDEDNNLSDSNTKTETQRKKKRNIYVKREPIEIIDDNSKNSVTIIDVEECNPSTANRRKGVLDINIKKEHSANSSSVVTIADVKECNPSTIHRKKRDLVQNVKQEPTENSKSGVVTIINREECNPLTENRRKRELLKNIKRESTENSKSTGILTISDEKVFNPSTENRRKRELFRNIKQECTENSKSSVVITANVEECNPTISNRRKGNTNKNIKQEPTVAINDISKSSVVLIAERDDHNPSDLKTETEAQRKRKLNILVEREPILIIDDNSKNSVVTLTDVEECNPSTTNRRKADLDKIIKREPTENSKSSVVTITDVEESNSSIVNRKKRNLDKNIKREPTENLKSKGVVTITDVEECNPSTTNIRTGDKDKNIKREPTANSKSNVVEECNPFTTNRRTGDINKNIKLEPAEVWKSSVVTISDGEECNPSTANRRKRNLDKHIKREIPEVSDVTVIHDENCIFTIPNERKTNQNKSVKKPNTSNISDVTIAVENECPPSTSNKRKRNTSEKSNDELEAVADESDDDDCSIVINNIIINCDTSSDEENGTNAKNINKKTTFKSRDSGKALDMNASDFPLWSSATVLSLTAGITEEVANNVINLIEDENTLPFIARYRKTMVNFMSPECLQKIFDTYDTVCKVKRKSISILKKLKDNDLLTENMQKSILSARSIAELNLLYEPIKTRKSYADKAKALGLEPTISAIMNNEFVALPDLCNSEMPTPEIVRMHLVHGLADAIYRDSDTLEEIRQLMLKSNTMLVCKRARATKKKEPELTPIGKRKSKIDNVDKYSLYMDFKMKPQNIKPHQTLAINRGEAVKALCVKVLIDDQFFIDFQRFCTSKWKSVLISESATEAYKRFIHPWIGRQVRSELTTKALKESIAVFGANLKRLLLTCPIKGHNILAIDPGFKNGCKVAIIGTSGQPLRTYTMYPKFKSELDVAKVHLCRLVWEFKCEVLALGNGTGCRETEKWIKSISELKKIPLVIVPEEGASIYSCSPEATKEFPGMDPNLISAISLARRVMDPLSELVKVDAKHLGIGMYQHDVPVKLLNDALNNVIINCVSFVGVDLNTCSHILLEKIAGLSKTKARNIIKHRDGFGPFKSREDLLKVFGIGQKTYKQCAGFLRVFNGSNKFDNTWIHPESYDLATKMLSNLNLNKEQIGSEEFVEQLRMVLSSMDLEDLAKKLNCKRYDVDTIIEALEHTLHDDSLRNVKPIYSVTFDNVNKPTVGSKLMGVVRNVTSFGMFIDLGVGNNGLLHNSQIGNLAIPQLGDKILVQVISSNIPSKISLKLIQILE